MYLIFQWNGAFFSLFILDHNIFAVNSKCTRVYINLRYKINLMRIMFVEITLIIRWMKSQVSILIQKIIKFWEKKKSRNSSYLYMPNGESLHMYSICKLKTMKKVVETSKRSILNRRFTSHTRQCRTSI